MEKQFSGSNSESNASDDHYHQLFAARLKEMTPKILGKDGIPILRKIEVLDINAECHGCGGCNSKECIDEIVRHHRLSALDFYARVISYYFDKGKSSDEIPRPLHISVDDIHTLIDPPLDCSANCIVCDISEGDITTHQNMGINIEHHCPPPDDGRIYYSIALFRGLLALTPSPTSFEFIRMYDMNTRIPSMGIKVMNGDIEIYHGDLSSDFPIMSFK